MRIEVRSFEDVFDGSASFVPRAILDLSRAQVPEVAGLMQSQSAVRGEDGLDEFLAVPLVFIPDRGRQRRFALWRHAHNPPDQVAIQLPLNEEFQEALAGIMTAMHIPAAALVWLDQPNAPSLP